MRKIGASLALTAAFVSGCSSGSETHTQQSSESSATTSFLPSAPAAPTTPLQPTFEQAKAEVVQDFDAAKGYWASKGVNLSTTQLQFVEGDQTVTCGDTYKSTSLAAGYCYNIGKFFVTKAWLEYEESEQFFKRSSHEIPRAKVLVFHEMGHAAQDAIAGSNIAAFLTDESHNSVPYELDADCKAGQTLRGLDPGAAELVNSLNFLYFPGDERVANNIHGTSAERKASFISGFNGGDCQVS